MIDVYQLVTDRMIKALEAGAPPWVRPWRSIGSGSGSALPVNGATGRSYSGINVVMLWGAAQERGFSSSTWYTYKQAQDVGGQVRKGAKSELVTFWKTLDIEEKKDDGSTEEKRIPMVRTYNVFNADEVDGLPGAVPMAPAPSGAHLAIVDGLKLRGGLAHGGDRAYFAPALDMIGMPNPAAFADEDAYVATLLHECTHATGAKERLDRDLSGRFGSDRYAMEELVAELGAAFTCAALGRDVAELRHAGYVDHWLKVLKADKKAIFAAAALARRASESLLTGAGLGVVVDDAAMAAK